MTQTLRFLTETPEERSPLLPLPRDILSDVLRIIRFSGAIDLRTEFSAPWTIETLPCADFAAALQCPTKHIIPFHIVAKGNCWVKATNGICKALAPGDIIIFPHGDSHILGDRLDREPVSIDRLLPAPPWNEPPILKYGGGGEMTQLVCGFLQCEELLLHPFFKSLPPLMHIQTFAEPTTPLLETGVRYIIQEAECFKPGSMCLLTRLVELMFVEIVRDYMQQVPEQRFGWLSALNDPIIGQVLEWIHANPSHPWTVPKLAKQIGVSRSVLATRFTQLLGQPPIQYLNHWRLQLASHHLQNTDDGIGKVASLVGYESEAAFNRAFKRYVGMPPGVWRKRQCLTLY